MKEMSSWITVADWMLDLGLDARELMIFALVYGVCSHNERYYGTREHTAKWARCTADTAGKVLNSLAAKGLLLKQEELNHGAVRRCYYTVDRTAVRNRLEEQEEREEKEAREEPGGSGGGGEEGQGPDAGVDNPVDNPVDNSSAGAKNTVDGSENRSRAGAKIAPATGAKIADNINSITDIKDRDKGQEGAVFFDPDKKAKTREDATTLFLRATKLWNGMDLKPGCRDLIIPPSEYDCLRTFQQYTWGEIENAIRNYDWHVKGRCGKGFRPPPPYGSIYGFLKSGVARYYDDNSIDQQFKERKYGA